MKTGIDIALRAAITGTVNKAMTEIMEQYNERWVTAKELRHHFSFFSESWLDTYGHLLDRTRVSVKMPDGSEHNTGWNYPLHKIARMVETGELKEIQWKDKMKKERRGAREKASK